MKLFDRIGVVLGIAALGTAVVVSFACYFPRAFADREVPVSIVAFVGLPSIGLFVLCAVATFLGTLKNKVLWILLLTWAVLAGALYVVGEKHAPRGPTIPGSR